MSFDYPYEDIEMNGRLVSLSSVIDGTVVTNSPFEREACHFIRAWAQGQKSFVQNTSGSTGTPKPIEITRDQMLASAARTQQALNLRKKSTSLLCIDPKFIGGKMMIVRSLMVGMKMICIDPVANPLTFLRADQCVNFAAFVPYQIVNILGSKRPHSLDQVEVAIIGGSNIDATTIGQLNNHKASCYATYGMTETVSHIALRKLNGADRQEYFHVLPGIQLAQDHRGCLIIRAPFLEEAVVTNDLVHFRSDSEFQIIGRWDNVINSGGVKVIPEKAEAAIEKLFSSSGIQTRFFIHGLTDKLLGQKVTIIVEADSHTVGELEPVLSKLLNELSRYELPRSIAFVPSFVMTESCKINRLQTIKNIETIRPLRYPH